MTHDAGGISDTHWVFTMYGAICGFHFSRDEQSRAFQALVRAAPVGSKLLFHTEKTRPRIAFSEALTRHMEAARIPVALRHIYPPHGLYYYTTYPGANGSPGVPARIVEYTESASRVRIVVPMGSGIDTIANVDPLDLLPRDISETYAWAPQDLIYLYSRLGGITGGRDVSCFLDPIGFMYYGL